MNRRSEGAAYEELACRFLINKGYKIIERNFSCRQGEIDIIAEKGNIMAMVEVKYRSSISYGEPAEAVDFRKRMRISKTAEYYVYSHGNCSNKDIRFDIIAVYRDRSIEHIENAFEFAG